MSVTGMTSEIALLDANVLYSAPLRDLLLQLAFTGLYQARWSADIEDEWKRNLIAARPNLADRIERTQEVMRRALPDAIVEGYAHLIPMLSLRDPDDRHVLAAAVIANAEVIVTFNGRDFPREALAPYDVVALHPDTFLRSLIANSPTHVLAGVRTCLVRLSLPLVTQGEYLATLRRIGLPETTAFLAENTSLWRP